MLILKEISPQILILATDDGRPLADYFMRFQEHYESPKFQGLIFTVAEFESWYETQEDTLYRDDWYGFNLPSSVLAPFLTGSFDPLNDQEKQLLDIVSGRSGPFYLIGANSPEVIDHELCHALWFTNPEYRAEVTRILDAHAHLPAFRSFVTALEAGYAPPVVMDEMQAYHMEKEGDSYDDQPLVAPLRDALMAIRHRYPVFHTPSLSSPN